MIVGGHDDIASDTLAMWTVYDHPNDHPDMFVARKFCIGMDGAYPTDVVVQSSDIEKIREQMKQHGLHRLERDPSDDAKIVETWI